MSSTSNSTDERINTITIAINNIILYRLGDGTITEADAKLLSNLLLRIRTEPDLLNAIMRFNESFIALDINRKSTASSVSNNNTVSSAKIASMIVSLL